MWYIHTTECYSATKGNDVLMHATRRNVGLIPVSGRSAGVGNCNPSSILPWEIPGTEEPGELQSLGSQRAGNDWAHTHTHNRLDLENMLMEISQNRKKNYLWCHLYEVSRIRQILGDRNCYHHLGAGPIGNHCLIGIAFLFEMMIKFWK